ncbi:DUF1643 domain-containing protein [Allomesorhizobium alhagi]|uniref:DUF1643 domain-containing protein n=1 Tax=Mesorhizobium alhagi CCNWXJ12-2 TaxID=1107882 RepID=H0HNE5_9HYPH|nr:DUF1643 domain-containing protein [Mesorhizobium alhagi]EHK57717.1 hypothetical protein MAXJ12_08339 [Mesorhizobium alhagi CCNWXJ12-2]
MSIRPQPDLFDDMEMSAIISDCGLYRTELRRVWNSDLPLLVVCMLNPSTADHRKNDPTILALIHFGKLWGYGGLLVINLFAFRSPSPADMMAVSEPFGPCNARAIADAMEYARDNGGRLLAAWGNHGDHHDRAEWFCNRALQVYRLTLICLGTTKGWKPKHPMARGKHRIPRDQQPIVWRAPV